MIATPAWRGIRFGLGLLEIGRTWGHRPRPVPDRAGAIKFLGAAWETGVRLFDTAPSYGDSEEKLGEFLRSLSERERDAATVATKFGEHWDEAAGGPFDDHSYEALRRSFDRSLKRLGRIDVLQVHKSTVANLGSDDVRRALAYAAQCGVAVAGASVRDLVTAQFALESGLFQQLQFPFNSVNETFLPVLAEAKRRGLLAFTNRPFQMGELVAGGGTSAAECLRHVARAGFDGAVLAGTANAEHLREDWEAFQQAVS